MLDDDFDLPISPKQRKSYLEATARINIWCGAVRSGKTFSSILRFIKILKETRNSDGDVMIIGVSRTSIQQNVLGDLYKLLGLPCPSSKRLEDRIYGKNIYFVGAHNESAVRRIQGSTLSLAYVDEATCLPQPFWQMLLSRLSVENAQLLATCNPSAPKHWLKKEYIDRADDLDLKHWKFELDDNPILSDKYKESLKKEYSSGHWYKRFILGDWCIAHGLIYDTFDTDNIYSAESTEKPEGHIIGVDYGTSNATAAVMCALSPNRWPQVRVCDEYYYDSKKQGRSKTDANLADDLYEFSKNCTNLDAIYVDPSAASLKLELRNKGLPVLDAKNDVINGIRTCSKLINQKSIVIHSKCKNLTEAMHSYSWDEKAALQGEDRPLKEEDHIVDSFRYAIYSRFPTADVSNSNSVSIDAIRREVYGDASPSEILSW
jgi:PBSX family phage terminase large subunit